MVQPMSPTNEFGAFCSGARVELLGSSAGPLRGLRFAAKDNFDVEGLLLAREILIGNKRTHPRDLPPSRSVNCLQPARRLLERRRWINSAADIAPRLGVESDLAHFHRPTLCLMSIAGVAGLPQITLPLAEVENCPVGLSLIGPPGSDEQLINLALQLGASGS
jgi:hypothetical protein